MSAVDARREVTPALVRGRRGSVEVLREGELAPGLEGQLCHHAFAEGATRRESTAVLTTVPEGVAFAPALVCRDRGRFGGGAPAQVPGERWEPIELESSVFNRRYALRSLAGQDAIYAREVFTPGLISWLAHEVPSGFSFELNERFLVVSLPGHLAIEEELERLCGLAAELARRLHEEAVEEGEGTGLFDESEKLAEIEANLRRVRFERPPESAGIAVEAFRERARYRPTVVLSGVFWGIVGFGVIGLIVTLIWNPIFGLLAGIAAFGVDFWMGNLMAANGYSWGRASVRRLGLEAFLRGYAGSRGLREESRWRFASRYRSLPLPGTPAFVAHGPIAEGEREAYFLTLGDAAELRSLGSEVAFASERPLASAAVVAELASETAAAELLAAEPPEGVRIEARGSTIAIWRPFPGNLAFTAAAFDELRAAAARLLAKPS